MSTLCPKFAPPAMRRVELAFCLLLGAYSAIAIIGGSVEAVGLAMLCGFMAGRITRSTA
jgi:hypothetical protein